MSAEREWQCPDCGETAWVDEEDEATCEDCGVEMDMLTRDRCNGCGRELMGRDEHEMGLCPGCA